MHPAHLMGLLTSLSAAAEVVEAIDQPLRRALRGWDLRGWRYELVPWGVRFIGPDGLGKLVSVVVRAEPDGLRVALVAEAPAAGRGV